MEKIIGSCCAAIALMAFVSSCTEEQKRPNIICIVCEDISPMVGCFGDKVAVTPNLDEFSKSAIRFTNVHSNIGVSSPSRYALITGRYPMADGANYMRTLGSPEQKPEGVQPYSVIVNPDVKCYTEYLRKAGYYCTNNAKTDYQFTIPATAWDECGTDAHWMNRPEGMPFFSIFNIEVTHESRVWRRTNEKLSVNPSDIVVPPYYPDNDIVRHDMAVAYSNITEMDKMFKKLVDELKEANVYDNTIIIWYSDNGGPLPHHKREIYDRGTNVPFMISFPDGYKAGTVLSQLVNNGIDFYASVCDWAGVSPIEGTSGVSYRKLVEAADADMKHQENIVIETTFDKGTSSRGWCVCSEKYKYIMYDKGRYREQLYDMEKDRGEMRNLAVEAAYKDELYKYRTILSKWMDEHGVKGKFRITN